MNQQSAIDPHRGNNLDLLRLLFASMVLLAHTPEVRDGNRGREPLSLLTGDVQSFGDFSVDGFFVLSGYLIMASWARSPGFGSYLKNRVLRIYPGFIVAFCVSVLIAGPIAATDIRSYFNQFTITRFLFSLFTLREPWFAYSNFGSGSAHVNSSLWTISYEFTCYLTVALLATIARRSLRMVWLTTTVLLLVAACFLPEMQDLPQVNRFTVSALVTTGSMFFVGGSLFLIGFKGSYPAVVNQWGGKALTLTAGLLLVMTAFSPRFHVVGFALFGSLFFLSIGLNSRKISFARNWPDISYGTYLYGWPVLQLLIWSLPALDLVSLFLLSLMFSLGCGYLSWHLVEKRFLRMKRRSRPMVATSQ